MGPMHRRYGRSLAGPSSLSSWSSAAIVSISAGQRASRCLRRRLEPRTVCRRDPTAEVGRLDPRSHVGPHAPSQPPALVEHAHDRIGAQSDDPALRKLDSEVDACARFAIDADGRGLGHRGVLLRTDGKHAGKPGHLSELRYSQRWLRDGRKRSGHEFGDRDDVRHRGLHEHRDDQRYR